MGHVHLGVLPGTRKWRAVVQLLEEAAPEDQVISAAATAAEKDLRRAVDDPVFIESLRLLATLPLVAGSPDFQGELRRAGIDAPRDLGLFDLVAAISARLDTIVSTGRCSDFSELSRRSLLATLTREVGDALPGLFEATPDDLQAALRRMAAPRAFARLARAYFTDLLSQTLSYWLDRTLSAQVGPGRRFNDVGERRAFDDALAQYSMEATRIIREFAAGWYGKSLSSGTIIGTKEATIFGAVAFKKIVEELARKRDDLG